MWDVKCNGQSRVVKDVEIDAADLKFKARNTNYNLDADIEAVRIP